MNLVAVLVVLAVVGVVAAVVVGAVHGGLDEPTSTLPPAGLPEGDLAPEDLDGVRFSLGFRGYRMDEVDEVLERVTAELTRRDADLAWLRDRLQEQREPAPSSGEPAAQPTTQPAPQPPAGPSAEPGDRSGSRPDSQAHGETNGEANGQPNGRPHGVARPAATPQRT